MTALSSVLVFAHQLLIKTVRPGEAAIDATMGNGHDTLVLAQCTTETGRVYAFDIQERALEKTRKRLQAAAQANHVQLIADGHQHISHHVRETVAAVIFNLGYLPGGNKALTTQWDTSLAAIEQSLALLRQHGLLLLVLYPGHEPGKAEQEAIEAFVAKLDQQEFQVLRYQFINQKNNPPYLLAIEKLSAVK